MLKQKAVVSILALLACASANASCNKEQPIQIANMTFASASIVAHIESKIIGDGFGCNVELVPGDTVTTATTMAKKGAPDVGPEMWTTNISAILAEGEHSGNLVVAGDIISSGGVEGWWIPKYLSEQYPDFKSVADMPRYAELFSDPNEPEKGRFYNCPPGWGCEIVNHNLFKAYGLGDSYSIFSPGSGAALDATIASAYKRKKPWIGYYWGPTAILGKYDMVQLEMNPHDPELDACNSNPECAKPHAGAFSNVRVVTAVSSSLKASDPDIYQFLSQVSMDLDTYNAILSWSDENKKDPNETAEYFIENYASVWEKWVPAHVATRLKNTQDQAGQ
ncbi:ABC transporter substrate-binding protein [Marinobacterium rhizophilum]|uniref:ABC transporter substrate-binding protein n=1 Tax=Marinobacterium rhizophilum TaxID=420402 RepID=A0ABY5HKY0_9GAMM|nr:ABC transporter substrate-binding protein [Marinobacterium rhizophilum]UTW13050.1 ABC transporter substrate-binding protein [Marinobacterium rhizophilum]